MPNYTVTGTATSDSSGNITSTNMVLTLSGGSGGSLTANGSTSPAIPHGTVPTIVAGANPSPSATDWIGIYPAGTQASNNNWSSAAHNWAYLNDQTTPPGSIVPLPATIHLWITMPATAGSYTLGYFSSNTYTPITTIPVTVT